MKAWGGGEKCVCSFPTLVTKVVSLIQEDISSCIVIICLVFVTDVKGALMAYSRLFFFHNTHGPIKGLQKQCKSRM